jgi:putative transposase
MPEDDKHNKNQVTSKSKGSIIALDPGVRKFLVGYDPNGQMIFFGEGASKNIQLLLVEHDMETDDQKKKLIYRKIKYMVDDLHWKSIKYLTDNYKTILLPEYNIRPMVKSFKIGSMTKRLMYVLSPYKFKERLIWKCSQTNTNIHIVNESYTSCTCTNCGEIKKIQGCETYHCDKCGCSIDRDVNGARNIFIKNMNFTLKKGKIRIIA